MGKNVMKMLTDHYDWTLAHELTNGAVYFANQYSGSQRDVDAKQVRQHAHVLCAGGPLLHFQQHSGTSEHPCWLTASNAAPLHLPTLCLRR